MKISINTFYSVNKILIEKLGTEKFYYVLSIYEKEKAKKILYKFFENIYEKRIINKEYIKNQYKKYFFFKCDDCYKKWIIESNNINLIKFDACADSSVGSGNCCIKYCCQDGCFRKLKCGHKNLVYPDDLETTNGLVKCNICNKKEKVHYCWNGLSSKDYMNKYGY